MVLEIQTVKDQVSIPYISQWETVKKSYVGKAIWKRQVLSLDLTVLSSLEDLTGRGRDFQTLSLAEKKLSCQFHF